MKPFVREFAIHTEGKGLVEITSRIAAIVGESGVSDGLVSVFVRHTSASLLLFENADPTAREDIEEFFDRLVPEDDPWFSHSFEGPDDMPAHIRMALTRSSETIPVKNGRMLLGVWQGVFLFEHRAAPHRREIVVTVLGG